MKYLPYEKISYITHLSSEQIKKRLENITEPKKIFRWKGIFASSNHAPYEGNVNINSFKINRILHRKMGFLPLIEGEIQSEKSEGKEKTTVHLTMRLSNFILAYLIIWLSYMIILLLPNSFINVSLDNNVRIFISLAIVIFYVISIVKFNQEVSNSKKDLEEVFGVESKTR
ncbi:hypothetical protein V9L05_03315 [Bernardetia sp. Wsw4-3y2]|uniref:hypothetical protein n=1 Tax=Bernardetia sp. Wsw4-3y2 TaxID=3127471 RepID=UPI0030CF2073